MGEQAITAIVTIVTAIIGVAVLSVLLSRQSNTAGVLQAGGSALAMDLAAAVAPITGSSHSLGGFGGGNFMPQIW